MSLDDAKQWEPHSNSMSVVHHLSILYSMKEKVRYHWFELKGNYGDRYWKWSTWKGMIRESKAWFSYFKIFQILIILVWKYYASVFIKGVEKLMPIFIFKSFECIVFLVYLFLNKNNAQLSVSGSFALARPGTCHVALDSPGCLDLWVLLEDAQLDGPWSGKP